MKFLDGAAAEGEIRRLLGATKRARIAVAYWGAGAVERLGISELRNKDVQIACDLRSGGCNPDEVKRLLEIGADQVRTCDRLHAKVWLTDGGAVIGSSNASANGLGYEGDETRGLIEANVLIEDSAVLTAMSEWFQERVWNNSSKITPQDLERARLVRRRIRNDRLPPQSYSIFRLLKENQAWLADRNFSVWIYLHGGLDDWAEELCEYKRRERHEESLDCWQISDKEARTPPGAYILDFDLINHHATYDGLYQVVLENPIAETKEGKILLCRTVNRAYGLRLHTRGQTPHERRILEEAATRAAKAEAPREEWPITEFARYLRDI